MAETPGDANLGPAGTHLMEFSHRMQQREGQEPRPPAKVIQLPLWPEAKRGVPNAVLRGALFAAIHKDRQYMRRKELITTQDGVTIKYTGEQLDQADLDVWEQVLHLARTQALGTKCYFTAHGFLKALGRQTGRTAHEWLEFSLIRLAANAVEITAGQRMYFGSLIEGGIRDKDTGRYVVEINPKLAAFYGRTQWTQIDRERRIWSGRCGISKPSARSSRLRSRTTWSTSEPCRARASSAIWLSAGFQLAGRNRHVIGATEARHRSDRGPAEIHQKSSPPSHLANRQKSANRLLIVY